jgi:predicted nucleic acid-binding protein
MESYSLLPRDALHLTTMAEHGINSVVTTDADFLPINGLRIYTCNPKMLASLKV